MSLSAVVGERTAALVLLLSDAVRRNPEGYLQPLGVGAFGGSHERPRIALYLDRLRIDLLYSRTVAAARETALKPEWVNLNNFKQLHDQLLSDFSTTRDDDLGDFRALDAFLEGLVFLAPPPALHAGGQAGTGDMIIAGNAVGTLGAEVLWTDASGSTMFGNLTAGHVAGPVNTVVHGVRATGQIGTVAFTHTASGGTLRGEADVALVSVGPWTLPIRAPHNIAFVPPGSSIEIALGGGPTQANVKGMWAWLNFPGTNVVLGNTYMTDYLVTQQGDSGALAYTAASEAVGHVVGGTSQGGSYIQEIDYQLTAIRSQPPFGTIVL